MKDIYSDKIKRQLFDNKKQVKNLLEEKDKGLIKRIQIYSDKFDMAEDIIKAAIRNDDAFAINYFAKDPKKQNIYEKIAAEFIKKIQGVTDFENLGNNVLFLSQGSIYKKHEKRPYPNAKTIDFIFQYNSKQIYASHKYTDAEGGAQGSQYKDLKTFIEEARDNKDKDTFFIAIADGPFYQRNDVNAGTIRIDNLRNMCTSSVRACAITELEEVLKAL